MLCTDLPVRVTSFLRDPSTGLAKNGIYDISEESKNRSIIISSRIAHRKQKELELESKSAEKLTWKIYSNHLDPKFVENLRFINELRSEFSLFMTLINKYVLAGILYSSNEVNSATYIILKGIYKIYRQKQKHFGNDEKIRNFIETIRDDITKYFNKISNKQWNQIYDVGLKLLYFLSNPPLEPKAFSKTLKDLNADTCDFDYNSLPKSLFSKLHTDENENESKDDEYKLNECEYGQDIQFNDPLIEINALLLPQMTALEKKQFSVENHKPSNAARFKQSKAKNTENGQHKNKKKQNKKQSKTGGIDKYSVEWIREKAQLIAMMKLQVLLLCCFPSLH